MLTLTLLTNDAHGNETLFGITHHLVRTLRQTLHEISYCSLDKHFPPHHRLHSIFNRHTVRVSYSFSDNMESFLSKHNKYVLKKHNDKAKNTKTNIDTKTCNCRKPDECPVSNTCLAKSLVYKAEVSTDKDNAKVYNVVTANSFKERFRNHTKSIKNERHGNETELSKYIWKLKRAKCAYDNKMVDRQTRTLMQSWFPKMQSLS